MNFQERRIRIAILQENANKINENIDKIAQKQDLTERQATIEYSRKQSIANSQLLDKKFQSMSTDDSQKCIGFVCTSGFKHSESPKSVTQSQYQDIEDMYLKEDLLMDDPQMKNSITEENRKQREQDDKRIYLIYEKDRYKELVEENKKTEDQFLTSNNSFLSKQLTQTMIKYKLTSLIQLHQQEKQKILQNKKSHIITKKVQ